MSMQQCEDTGQRRGQSARKTNGKGFSGVDRAQVRCVGQDSECADAGLGCDAWTPAARMIPGDPVPLLAHWLYFLDFVRNGELGDDGHPERGGFLPAVTLARRMWAGSRVRFFEPMRIGDKVGRVSTIVDIESKSGRTADLVFVTLEHEVIRDDGTVLIREQQDIVYRDAPAPGVQRAASPASAAPVEPAIEVEPPPTWRREVMPASSLLFRYSALTFNSHRIHYDRDYARHVEGYPGLVVHGPLQATLMLDQVARVAPGD
ncbi:hydroxyacyl-ACP dehydratase HTD2-like protein with hotdog domain [Paraburkholderia sp. MM6662-R1]